MAAILNYRLARDLSPSDPERNLDLGLSLYLARDYPGAATSLQVTLRLMPTSGTAHYYLALTYWNQGQYVLALAHARLAQEHGVSEAKPMIQTLSAGISRSTPGNVSSQGSRR
jgi:tetratricopeptide (TPR) repeat protein